VTVEEVMSGGVVGCVDGMSEGVMGSIGSDWSERTQRVRVVLRLRENSAVL